MDKEAKWVWLFQKLVCLSDSWKCFENRTTLSALQFWFKRMHCPAVRLLWSRCILWFIKKNRLIRVICSGIGLHWSQQCFKMKYVKVVNKGKVLLSKTLWAFKCIMNWVEKTNSSHKFNICGSLFYFIFIFLKNTETLKLMLGMLVIYGLEKMWKYIQIILILLIIQHSKNTFHFGF